MAKLAGKSGGLLFFFHSPPFLLEELFLFFEFLVFFESFIGEESPLLLFPFALLDLSFLSFLSFLLFSNSS